MSDTKVDWTDQTRNLYGCTPCPKCGSAYRASYQREGGRFIECDECGFSVKATEVVEE